MSCLRRQPRNYTTTRQQISGRSNRMQNGKTIEAQILWQMFEASMPRPTCVGVSDWADCPAVTKAGYYGLAVRLAHYLGLPEPLAPDGVSPQMLVAAISAAPELPDTPPRK